MHFTMLWTIWRQLLNQIWRRRHRIKKLLNIFLFYKKRESAKEVEGDTETKGSRCSFAWGRKVGNGKREGRRVPVRTRNTNRICQWSTNNPFNKYDIAKDQKSHSDTNSSTGNALPSFPLFRFPSAAAAVAAGVDCSVGIICILCKFHSRRT